MPVAVKNYAAPATERQLAFIAKLAKERNKTVTWQTAPTRKAASETIERLLALPKPVTQAAPVTPGVPVAPRVVDPALEANTFHALDGEFYRVIANQHSGRLYAQKWNGRRFQRARGAIFDLNTGTVATEAQAAQFGRQFGVCGICGRTLTDPPSVARGIGPVCIKRLGWSL